MFRAFLLITLLIGIESMAIEEPSYVVETKNDDYEIRKYSPMIVAETLVTADFDKVGSLAFRILADYIFGNNQSQTKIEMTSPVNQQPSSEKIAMTAPVTQAQAQNGYWLQFTMPANYTLATLPKPNDSRVHLRELSAQRRAVYSYSGSWSEEKYKEKLNLFRAALSRDKVKTVGEPVFARYNSPFQLWFLRRNEIWLTLAEDRP